MICDSLGYFIQSFVTVLYSFLDACIKVEYNFKFSSAIITALC